MLRRDSIEDEMKFPVTDTIRKDIIHQMIRVNQAGEYGAKRIYEGQMRVTKNPEALDDIKEMYEQELKHLDFFNDEMKKRRVRPTAFSPAWHILGYAMGAITAKLGNKAAMTCTIAVEDVIAKHYHKQLEMLESIGGEDELREKIEEIRQEEIAHADIGHEYDPSKSKLHNLLYGAVKTCTRVAIALSKRI